jgi:restriction endonuclease S subunit
LSVIKLLNNGSWNKPPVLTAARRILMDGLAGNWQQTELGDLATFVNGTSYDRGLLADTGTPIIRISNMTDPRTEYLTTSQSFDAKYMVQPDDLLVSWSASFKSVIWPGPSGVLNQHIFKVTEKPGNHRGFIRHAIEAVFDDMQSKVVGIGMMHLRRRDFLGHRIPAPNHHTQEAVCRFLDWLETPDNQPEPTLPRQLSEQRRIVARIEELAARIEEARGLRRQAVEEAEALLSSALRHLLKPTDTWEVKPIATCSKMSTGTTPPSQREDYFGGELQWYTPGDLEFRKELGHSSRTISDAAVADGKVRIFRPGTILLVAIGASLGKIALTHKPCSSNQQITGIKFSSDILPDYGFWWMRGLHKNLRRAAPQATLPIINQRRIGEFTIAFPSLREQSRIVSYLDDLQTKVRGEFNRSTQRSAPV